MDFVRLSKSWFSLHSHLSFVTDILIICLVTINSFTVYVLVHIRIKGEVGAVILV